MFIYFVVFFFSAVFYYLGRIEKKPIKAFPLYCICIFLPVLMAAFRDITVGRDLSGYGVDVFYDSLKYNSFAKFSSQNSNEIGYLLVNWISSRVSKDIHFFLGIHELIVCLLFWLTSQKVKSNMEAIFIWIVFLLLLFNVSLSLLRQIISVGLIFYGTSHYYYGKKYMFFVCVAIAQLFHNSSVFALIIPGLHWIVIKYSKHVGIVYVLIIATAIISFYSFHSLLAFTVENISSKYANYMNQDHQKSHKIDLLVFGMVYLGSFIYVRKNTKYCNLFRSFVILYLSIIFMGNLFETANRLAFNVLGPIFLLCNSIFPFKKQKRKLCYYIIFILMFNIILKSLRNDIDDTVPYTSSILGIE